MKKILLGFMVVVLLQFNIVGSYHRAYAIAPLIGVLAVEAAPIAYTGAMIAVTEVAAAAGGVAAVNWVNNHRAELETGARETSATLSTEAKNNFMSNVNQLGDAIVLAGDWITSFFDKTTSAVNSQYGNNLSAYVSRPSVFQANIQGYYLQLGTRTESALHLTIDGTNKVFLSINGGQTTYYTFNTTYSNMMAIWSQWANADNLGEILDVLDLIGLSYKLYQNDGVEIAMSDPVYDSINNYARTNLDRFTGDAGIVLDDTTPYVKKADGTRARLDVNATGDALTLDGTKLNLNTDTKSLSLPDGTVVGNLEWDLPKTKTIQDAVTGATVAVALINGVWVNVLTGEAVATATAEEFTPIEGDPSKTKEQIENDSRNWGRLITTKFPFSLPWDFYFVLSFLSADVKVPRWEVKFDFLGKQTGFTIDLSFLDPYMPFFRGFIILGFAYTLIMSTRKLLGGAQ